MRDLTSRLRRIVRQDHGGDSRTASVPAPRELTYVPDVPSGSLNARQAAAALGGTLHELDGGSCVVVDREWAEDHWHGRRRMGSCGFDADAPLALFDSRAASAPEWTRRVVFFDIETTGLSGGAGTLAVLAGCAWFEDGGFRIRQFFLSGPSGERAMLTALAGIFDDASLLVTYNGRSFDVPLMETRWAFHRTPCPTDDLPHFDMLPAARRLWGRRRTSHDDDWGRGLDGPALDEDVLATERASCSLSALERSVLGFHRVGDVPGFEIPVRYFQFLRTGDPAAVEGVLEHNRWDLLSTAVVMAHALWLAREGPVACREPGEMLALGRLFERVGEAERAAEAYEAAASIGDRETAAHAHAALAMLRKRQRRFEESASAWQRVLDLESDGHDRRRRPPPALHRRAAEALAIHHEHRARDLSSAKEYAQRLAAGAAGRLRLEAEHRLGRLERKLKLRNGAADGRLSWDADPPAE